MTSFLDELSAWAAAQGHRFLPFRYGDHPDQIAELTMPEDDDGPYPVAVLLHGGFWRLGFDHTLMDALAVGLAARGWASWNVEYRRGPGSAALCIGDVRAAIVALTRADAPLDLSRLAVIGHSAGGHLALLVASELHAADRGSVEFITRGAADSTYSPLVIALAPVTDLEAAAYGGLGSGAAAEFMGGTPRDLPALYTAMNPMDRLPTGVRTLLVHGDADDRVPIAQSRAYHSAAVMLEDACELLELPGEGHFAVIDPRSEAFGAYAARLDQM